MPDQTVPKPAPKGQKWRKDMPRFGLPAFANRLLEPDVYDTIAIKWPESEAFNLRSEQIAALPQVSITADFHCVTTWSVPDVTWQGVLFRTLFETAIAPRLGGAAQPKYLAFCAHDGYRACLPLSDALSDRVLLASALDGKSAARYHGVPYRLVAPDHYGYKNVKFLKRIELLKTLRGYRPAGLRFMEHPRARVAQEERAQWLPGWLLRHPYGALIRPTEARFRRAWERASP